MEKKMFKRNNNRVSKTVWIKRIKKQTPQRYVYHRSPVQVLVSHTRTTLDKVAAKT
jgi:hypothetical protein